MINILSGATVVARVVTAVAVLLALPIPTGWGLPGQGSSLEGTPAEGYGVFFPELVGEDAEEFSSGGHRTEVAQAGPLYAELNSRGALYVDASAFSSPRPYVTGLPQHILTVNPNYLASQRLLKDEGGVVVVPDSEEAWVVLVPVEYRTYEAPIRSYFGEYRSESAPRSQRDVLGLEVPAHLAKQEVKIVWLAEGSKAFSHDARVAPHADHVVDRPIIEVVTMRNSLEIDRMNTVTGNVNAPLKVPLRGSAAETYDALEAVLESLELDDNLVAIADVQHRDAGNPFSHASPAVAAVALMAYFTLCLGEALRGRAGHASRLGRSTRDRWFGRFALIWVSALILAYGFLFALEPSALGHIVFVAMLVVPTAFLIEFACRAFLSGRHGEVESTGGVRR